ncbi:WXG100 family type VII secretion target [Amycolatopsis minnesotensis]|uniref:WXG100 family type VII secretion target n=1 Tax=Amycolatopsis minnesotensis TaxID=337894 RepID=A0ABP5DJT9_9PSEU
MADGGEYRAEPEAMRAGAGNVGGIIMQGVSAAADLERLVLAPSSFAAFGTAVATANGALQRGQVTALRSLLGVLQQVNDLVRRSADDYQSADEAVAEGYGGRGGTTAPSAIWGAPHAPELLAHAMRDSAGGAGEPGSVANVLRYLGEAGLGQLGEHPLSDSRFGGVADFNDWLSGDAGNQARIGMIEVYSGAARDFRDVPGGVAVGDMVVVEPSGGADPVIGIAGKAGHLFNHGRVDAALSGPVTLSVYRPALARP